jgi:DNA processing protein
LGDGAVVWPALPAALVLRCVRGVGAIGFRRAVEAAGSADDALQRLPRALVAHATEQAERVRDTSAKRGITVVSLGDAHYPATLLSLEDPPPVIFALGSLALLDRPAVGVVGARGATAYGLRATETLIPPLVRQGVVIVSGLALGIDAAAHQAALDTAGATIAVLGTGVDVPYPRENARLYRRIEASGLLLSEALPGAPAHPGSFPSRNRIIAALSDVVVVVEAGAKSGALITAQAAAGIGRLVGAVPGPIDAPSSDGTNTLLRDGAQVVTGAPDVLGLLALTLRGRSITAVPGAPAERPSFDLAGLSDSERQIVSILDQGPRLADELVGTSGLSARETASALSSLTLLGVVAMDAAGFARRR